MDKIPNLSPHLVTRPVALIAFGLILVVVLAIVGADWWAFALVVVGVVAAIAVLAMTPTTPPRERAPARLHESTVREL
jgi:peptidoglycan/LPS O-acetylase OafA/YrhL